jgi:hypothetical protein
MLYIVAAQATIRFRWSGNQFSVYDLVHRFLASGYVIWYVFFARAAKNLP